MDGFANILKLLKGCRSAFSLIIIIFAVLLFEQYTDYFRLLRLEMISNIESKCRYVGTEVGVQRQVRKGLDAIIFPQKADSFWQRLLAGIIPWVGLCVFIASAKHNRSLWLLPKYLFLLAFGVLPVILYEFFPSWELCLLASIIMLGMVMIEIYLQLFKEQDKKQEVK